MRLFVAGLASALLVAGSIVGAILVARSGGRAQSPNATFRGNPALPGIAMPTFALRDQDSRTVSSENLRGKVVVLTFLDSKCKEACPIIAVELGRAWRLLTSRERRQTVVVAISTDPRDDTPDSVRAFLARNHAGAAVRYLVGPVRRMRDLWHRFQILSSLESGNASTHSDPVRIYGRTLEWLATQHAGEDLSPPNLAHDIRVALHRS